MRVIGLVLALALTLAPLAAKGQQAGKVPRIGWLGGPRVRGALRTGFPARVEGPRLIEDQNIVIATFLYFSPRTVTGSASGAYSSPLEEAGLGLCGGFYLSSRVVIR
jgi:hypothetical protein